MNGRWREATSQTCIAQQSTLHTDAGLVEPLRFSAACQAWSVVEAAAREGQNLLSLRTWYLLKRAASGENLGRSALSWLGQLVVKRIEKQNGPIAKQTSAGRGR